MIAVTKPVPTIPTTFVTICNDLDGKEFHYQIPAEPDEVLKTCLPVERAREWLDWHPAHEQDGPLCVSLAKSDRSVVVRFHLHPDGDLETARFALDNLLDGEKGAYA